MITKVESPEINSHIYGAVDFQEYQKIFCEERIGFFFFINGAIHMQKKEFDPYLTKYTKLESK